jgi:hypothetical protein
MSEIDFLENKKHDDQKPKGKDGKKDEIIWSEPEKGKISPKSAPFSFLPFLNKKPGTGTETRATIDKNKIRQSRQEILKLIKHYENSRPLQKDKGKNFLATLGEKLKKQPRHKEILINYQRVFNQEKEQRNQIGKVFNIKPAAESQSALQPAGTPKHGWFNRLIKSAKGKRSQIGQALNVQPVLEKPETIKPPKIVGDSWLTKLLKLIRQKISALSAPKVRLAKVKSLRQRLLRQPEAGQPFAEIRLWRKKAEEIKTEVIKKEQPEPEPKLMVEEKKENKVEELPAEQLKPELPDEKMQPVIRTNLIRGEIITFFDWPSKIIVLISAILTSVFLIGVIYFGIMYYKKENQVKSQEQAQKFTELTQKINQEEVGLEKISDFQAKLKTTSQIFAKHLYWTNFFKFLEDNTIKDVYYSGFIGDTSGNYSLDALAVSYNNISEQAKILKNNKNITDVQVTGGEMIWGDADNKTKIKFILKFSILKNIFTE